MNLPSANVRASYRSRSSPALRRIHSKRSSCCTFPGTDRCVFEPVGGSEGNYFLRWRILLRIRRFFRPTLRRPFPRLRLPISGSSRSIAPPSRFSASKRCPLPSWSMPIPIFAICDNKLANIILESRTPGNRLRKSQTPERMETFNCLLLVT